MKADEVPPSETIHFLANKSVSASNLSSSNKLSFLALPFGPECYFGDSVPIRHLLHVVDSVLVHEVQRIEPKLPGYFAYSYKTPQDPEQDYCRVNLVEFLDIVKAEVKIDDEDTSVDTKCDVDGQRYFQMYLTKERSKPEYCLLCKRGNKRAGAIAAEAKAVTNSSFKAVAQGVALASEFAMDQVKKGFGRWDEVVVVFVLTYGDAIQFGAVYILEENFPCATMLTRPLSLLLPTDRDTVSRWVVALGSHCSQCAAKLRNNVEKPDIRCSLNANIFLKPIVTDDIKNASFAVVQLLSTFKTLHEYAPCRDYILFPLGVMGMPDEEQIDGRAQVMNCLIAKFKQGNTLYQSPGYPLIIYRKLDSKWRNCAECVVELAAIFDQFVEQVRIIFESVFMAGLVHLDGRLANFMFCDNGDMVKVKLLDWDSCTRVGYRISPAVREAFEGDARYPSGETHASEAVHIFFLNKIVDDLTSASLSTETSKKLGI